MEQRPTTFGIFVFTNFDEFSVMRPSTTLLLFSNPFFSELKTSLKSRQICHSASRLTENNLRARYCMLTTAKRQLCVAPPRPFLSTYGRTDACAWDDRDYFFSETSPVNMQMPAYRYIQSQVSEWKEPDAKDATRRRLRRLVGEEKAESEWNLFAAGRYAAFDNQPIPVHYNELVRELILPLELRLAIDTAIHFSRYFRLEPLPRQQQADEEDDDDGSRDANERMPENYAKLLRKETNRDEKAAPLGKKAVLTCELEHRQRLPSCFTKRVIFTLIEKNSHEDGFLFCFPG
jgi:hypothetical protein